MEPFQHGGGRGRRRRGGEIAFLRKPPKPSFDFMNHPFRSISLLALAGLSAGMPLYAIDAPLLDDTYAYQSSTYTGTNFGNAVELRVLKSGTATVRTYLKFDLSTLPAGTTAAQITKATLRLWVDPSSATFGAMDVTPVTGSWIEKGTGGMTATNSASLSYGPVEVAGWVGATAPNEFVTLDLTDLVRDWVGGTLVNGGICLAPNASVTAMNIYFDSKETTATSHEPKLEIVLSGPMGPDGRTWQSGSGAPAAGVGAVGDFYLDTASSRFFGPKTAAGWAATGLSMVGPQGAPGVGAAGPAGPTGPSWRSGAGAPNVSVGAVNDFYLDTAASKYYGPKTAAGWGAGVSLVGIKGDTGPAATRIDEHGDLSMGTFKAGTLP